jgi:hypothetical protein
MAQQVEVPGVGILEFPDGMSQADMASAIKKNYPQIHPQQDQEPTSDTPVQAKGNQNMGDKVITNPGQVNMGLSPVYGNAPTTDSAGSAFASNLVNKLSLSQMPRLAGLVNAALPSGGERRGFGEDYARGKLNAEQYLAQQNEDHPVASGVGSAVGDTLPYMMGPEGGLLKKVIGSGAIGAAQGVGQGAANIDFSDDQARQAAITQLLKDGGIGAAGGVGGELLGAGAGVAASHLAPHAAGIQKSIVRKLAPDARTDLQQYLMADKPGAKNLFFSPSKASVDNPVLGAFKSGEASRDANLANQAQGAGLIGSTIDNVKQPVDTYDVLNELNKGRPSVASGRKGPYNAPGEGATDTAQDQFIANLPQPNAADVPLRNVQDMKTDLGDQTRFQPIDSAQSNANDANKRMWGNLKELIEQKVAASDPTGKATADLSRGNWLYRNSKNAEDLINNKIDRNAGNNVANFSAKTAMASALGFGGLEKLPEALLEGAGIEAANKYGSSVATSVLDHGARSKLGFFPQLSNFINGGPLPSEAISDDDQDAAQAQANAAKRKF